MNQLVGTAFNQMLAPHPDDGKSLIGLSEVIILMAEVSHYRDGAGDIRKERQIQTARFVTNAEGLRSMVASLTRESEELDKLAEGWQRKEPTP